MAVSFAKSISQIDSVDTVILVFTENNISYLKEEVTKIIGSGIPENKIKLIEKLRYKETVCFDMSYNKRVIRLVIASAGDKAKITRASVEKLGGFIYESLAGENINIVLKTDLEKIIEEAPSYIASGMMLKSWTFDKYKAVKKKQVISSLECVTSSIEGNETCFRELQLVIDGVFTTRNMVTEPANVMIPEKMLKDCEELKKLGIKVGCLDIKEMKKLGMNALIGVSLGSDQPAYVITLEYKGDAAKDLIAFVGKGLTFDSGGLCLKPENHMSDMKVDMTGAATVIGLIKTLALRKARVNVVGVLGVVENMISGKAQRPGDVVISMAGKSIEVDNTDAEGRLVLADCLWYTAEKFKPKVIIDLATLTGAIKVALGHEFAGLFSNSDQLSGELLDAGVETGEKLWRFPLHDSYKGDIKSDIADVKNMGCGRGAGSITAAIFLQNFVKDGIKWAHLDIAATETDPKNRALSQKGATGFGVRLLNEYLKQNYE